MLRLAVFLLGVLVALWLITDRHKARMGVITGTVVVAQVGRSISVVNEQTDPQGFGITLRDTVYEGDRAAIKPGARVTVWYKSVGERHPVASKVRVLVDSR